MKEQVGLLAGKVWQAVGREPGILMSRLSKTLGVDPSLAVFATGWLLREEKVQLEPQGRDFRIRLSPTEQDAWQRVHGAGSPPSPA